MFYYVTILLIILQQLKSSSWYWNINQFPFRFYNIGMFFQWSFPFITDFSYLLGSIHPQPNAVHVEPFSTSVFKNLTWIFATTTKICTNIYSTCIYIPKLYNKYHVLLHFFAIIQLLWEFFTLLTTTCESYKKSHV